MRIAAPMLIACAVLTACADSTTAPRTAPSGVSRIFLRATPGNPPPPFSDTSAAFVSENGETSARLSVRFNMNEAHTAGTLRFSVQQDDNSFGTSNAVISFSGATENNPNGTLAGTGILTVRSKEGYVEIKFAKQLESLRSFIEADCDLDTSIGTCGQIHVVGAKVYDAKGIPLRNVDGWIKIGVNSVPVGQGPG